MPGHKNNIKNKRKKNRHTQKNKNKIKEFKSLTQTEFSTKI